MTSTGSAHLLTAILQSLQAPAGRNTNIRTIVNNTAVTLSRLTNPLNVSLLTTQSLAAPAIWNNPSPLSASQAVFDIFRLSTQERARESNRALSLNEWIDAVVTGADARVPRWKHALVSSGILAAFEADDARLPFTTRTNLEAHLLEVVNFHFEFSTSGIETHACILAISNAYRLLSEDSRYMLNYPALTGALLPAMFLSPEGYQTGDFLRQIDRSVPIGQQKMAVVPSFSLKDFLTHPFVANMGALAKLAATSMASSGETETINGALSVLATYSRSLVSIWRETGLSTLPDDATISHDPVQTNTAQLWHVLKSSLFSAVVVLESIVRILLQSHQIARNNEVHTFASQILCILRDFYFITHRTNPAAFGTYMFVYHACVDIVMSNPAQAESLAAQLAPIQDQIPAGTIPAHPTDILRDLYFLNTLEYLVISCSPRFCTTIVSPSLTPYLTSPSITPILREPFESAHSLMLAMIGCPQLVESSYKILPGYIESVFAAYPLFLSTRQFRLAMASLIKFTSPPTALSGIQRDLPDIILEMLCARIEAADSRYPVKAYKPPSSVPADATPDGSAPAAAEPQAEEEFTERDVCILSMLDSLPFMEEAALERWLDIAAGYVGKTTKGDSREALRGRFWDVISGELDVGRSQLAIPWWSEGGREVVLGISA
ncbi:hypothetical protein TWF106_006523 [Orbilia oligospora]|uniref:Peroxisomal membrane protein PEX17 n=1 Tax=Orbilia oligospora TaxID=2813651 RepID=A0A7C8QQ74_ORBOL|nr:hypothetical protein TWF788_005088 [Orbilia oligospora]KAF3220926.1 hypothetical protein TWF106_006523 [Orbilia oligospora]